MKRKFLGKIGLILMALIIASTMAMGCPADDDDNGNGPGPGPGPDPGPDVKNPDTFIVASIGDVDSMDPAYQYDTASGEVLQCIYETLIYFDGEDMENFVPILATEWEISDDGLTYRFLIREGVTFHNGNELTPEDVEYTFERGMVMDYGMGPQWMFFEPLLGIFGSQVDDELIPLEWITDAVEVDGQWVQFNLTSPYGPFLQVLCGAWGGIVDKEWAIENGDWDGTQASYEALNDPAPDQSPLHNITNGTGPFMLDTWEKGIQTILTRNDDYWQGPAALETIVIKVMDEWADRRLALEQGDADWVYVPRQYISQLEGVEGLTVLQDLAELSLNAFFFQFEINPDSQFIGSGELDGNGIPVDFFSDVNVRKGFNHAFNIDVFIEDVMLGEGQQVGSPIIEGLAYFDEDAEMYAYDLEKAAEYLQLAWDGEVWENGFAFILGYNAGNDTRKVACEILAESLGEINPKFVVGVQAVQWPVFLDGIFNGNFPIYLIGWGADYPDPHNFVFPFFHSEGDFTAMQCYSNADVDALIEAAISAPADEREALYRLIDAMWIEEVPAILMAQPLGRRYFRDWVQGFYFNPINPADWGWAYDLSKGYD